MIYSNPSSAYLSELLVGRAGQGEQDGLAARPRKVGRAEARGGEGRGPQSSRRAWRA